MIADLEANSIAVITDRDSPGQLSADDQLHAITLWTAATAPTTESQLRALAAGYSSLPIVAICPPEDVATLASQLPAEIDELIEADQLFRMPRIISQWFERNSQADAPALGEWPFQAEFAISNQSVQPRLLEALEASAAGFALFDANGALTYANAGYADIARGVADLIKPGVTLKELRRVSLERGLVAQAVGREQAWLAERESAEQNRANHEVLRLDSGRWVQNHVGPLSDGGSFHVLTDISQQKAAEQQLKRSEQRLRDFVAAAASWLWETDSEDRYVFVSPGFERATGHSRSRILGRKRADARAEFILKRTTLGSSGEYDSPEREWRDTEIEFKHASGAIRHCLNTSAPIRDEAGRVVGHRGAVRDLTTTRAAERRATGLQAQLHRTQRAEVAGQVAGGIAHDFNNLLASILGYCELALRQPNHASNPRLLKYLLQIRLAGTRGRDLIGKLLTYSGAVQTEPTPHDLRALLNESLTLVRGTLPASVSIEASLAPALPRVEVDPISFEQVIMNLCINARDAMSERGLIKVTAAEHAYQERSCTACGKSFSGRYVAIRIHDSGPGVAPTVQLGRLFEPFFSTKGPGKGTGMGLAVVHGIVHDFGGHLEATSVAGGGLMVTVLLPPAGATSSEVRAEGDARAPAALARPDQPIRTVLIIDDEQSVGQMLSDFLESEGMRPTFVSRPAAGLARFESEPENFDLIITDLTMPGLSGTQVAQAVRAIDAEKPVLLCTGYQNRAELGEAEMQHLSAVLDKPIDLDYLLRLIRGASASERGAT
ncbi:MAG: PAS domain S-box protein [Pseudomonadota bacterium]